MDDQTAGPDGHEEILAEDAREHGHVVDVRRDGDSGLEDVADLQDTSVLRSMNVSPASDRRRNSLETIFRNPASPFGPGYC